MLAGLFLSFSAYAQMTDEQVLEYVKTSAASGKSESQISKELLARGVTLEQAERLKTEYEKKLKGENGSVTSKTLSGKAAQRNSSANELSFDKQSDPRKEKENVFDLMYEDGMMYDDGDMDTETASGRNLTRRSMSLREKEEEERNRIFGHDVFGKNSSLSFEPNENVATPENYVLGPGDEVIIEIWGVNEATISSVISPEGRINISQIGPIQLNGLTIKEATKKIKGKLAGKYAGVAGSDANISVTLGNIRTIQVNVLGLVNTPGTYRLSPFSSVFNALYRAGGVADNGSLRKIQIVRGDRQVAEVDIYEFLFTGRMDKSVSLQEGDAIIVPPYAGLVRAEGGVKRPMRYEIVEGETVEKLIEYAGGFASDAYRKDVKVVRNTGLEKEILTVRSENFASCELNDGDVLTVGANLDRYANKVEIRGYVMRPGEFQLGGDIATVRQLVNVAGGLAEDAYLGRALILREKEDLSLESVSINIGSIINGSADDVLLRKNDILVVSGIHELEDRGILTINGMVMNPGEFVFSDNTTVEDLILRAGGLLDGASTSRVDIARRIYDPVSDTVSDTLALAYTFSIENGLAADGGDRFVLEPYDVVTVRKSPGFRPQRFVEISGNVAFPGKYVLLNDSERITDLVERAGGFVGNANPRGAIMIRKRTDNLGKQILSEKIDKLAKMSNDSVDVDVEAEYIVAVDLDYSIAHPGCESDIILKDGDVINVPELVNTVQISGEVMSPNSVVYKKGKPVSYYINAAGGYTERGKRSKVYVIYQNGKASRNFLNNAKVEPGCTIVVPRKPERQGASATEVMATTSAAASLASVVATLIRLF